MAVQPLLICKACGFITPSGFGPIGSNGSATIVNCRQSCCGCGRMLGHPDVFSGGGSVHVINRDPAVVTILANLFEAVRSGREPTISEVDYQKLPPWAKKFIDAARGNRHLTGLAIVAIAWILNRGMDLAQVALESHLELRNSMLLLEKQAYVECAPSDGEREATIPQRAEPSPHSDTQSDLSDINGPSSGTDSVSVEGQSEGIPELLPQMLKAALQSAPPAGTLSAWRDLVVAMQEAEGSLWELRDGRQVTSADLAGIVRKYNLALSRLYSAVTAEVSKDQPQWAMPAIGQPKITIVGPGLIGELRCPGQKKLGENVAGGTHPCHRPLL